MARANATPEKSLVPVAIGGGLLFVLWQLLVKPPTSGKDWRGGSGTFGLQAGVVYRIEMSAPFSTNPALDPTPAATQDAVQKQLEQGGARNFQWTVRDRGVFVAFDQSYSEAKTLTFGTPAIGPFVVTTARRLDGLDWEAP